MVIHNEPLIFTIGSFVYVKGHINFVKILQMFLLHKCLLYYKVCFGLKVTTI
jgi:hypothetical protein